MEAIEQDVGTSVQGWIKHRNAVESRHEQCAAWTESCQSVGFVQSVAAP